MVLFQSISISVTQLLPDLETMTSILAAQPLTFPTNSIMTQMDPSGRPQILDPSLQRRPKTEIDDKNRGRGRSRPQKDNIDGSVEGSPDGGADGHSSGTDGPSRKRRRSRKGLDKKFECPQEGCGKSYSRAEHLYVSTRSQLPNMSPDICSIVIVTN